KRVGRSNAKKQSVRASASRRNREVAWTRCASCRSTQKHRRLCSASALTNPVPSKNQHRTSASDQQRHLEKSPQLDTVPISFDFDEALTAAGRQRSHCRASK